MFFTQELLARRDSGFGLLWLAATLGSKSAFKKLPKKSVLTADIAKLCDLISEPVEPLALRLSSNLMFGVVRVYKVKQEILLTDVSNCVTALKKVVLEMNTKAMDAQLHMAQTSVRPSAVTIVAEARTANILDYDAFVTDWDEFLNITDSAHAKKQGPNDSSDSEFDPTQPNKKSKSNKPKASLGPVEAARKDAHILLEHHEHLLSNTFDLSFGNAGDQSFFAGLPGTHGAGGSSSQNEGGGFSFDENPFQLSDGLDLGGDGFVLGDELARELGWGSPAKSIGRQSRDDDGMQMDFDLGGNAMDFNFEFNVGDVGAQRGATTLTSANRKPGTPGSKRKRANKENNYPGSQPGSRAGSVFSKRAPSPANSFGRLFLSQDDHIRATPLQDVTAPDNEQQPVGPKNQKKRTRLLLDARTELTDEELKVARAQYLEFQNGLKRDLLKKKSERDGTRLIEDLLWGVPKEIQEPSLVDFWQTNFKVQFEARSGELSIHLDDEPVHPARKKKRLSTVAEEDEPLEEQEHRGAFDDFGGGFDGLFEEGNRFAQDNAHRGSSEEPGQARRASSRPSSVFGGSQLGLDFLGTQQPKEGGNSGSQRSSLFPWDHAAGTGGPSSSSGHEPFAGLNGDDLNNVPVDHVEIRLRGSSTGRRSSVAPGSQMVGGGHGFSPIINGTPAGMDVDYEFNVDEAAPPGETQAEETQKSEVQLATLERNSFNFLEYAKMQYRTLQVGERLQFDLVVPQATSTRHVAAAAFYHCLVLATKDLIRLEQPVPYENVVIDVLL
ncbi:hypothetical protein FA13DRAFT_1788657 [Coprinellus micaceus]|uniref:Rad21/Rec8-like protein N-terminal domain-containing protein n=1 Tax=Coprinellus micaceus TaxID=71717 RepID=A0A4Y7TND0_COPMI|nr:hypothetical protein FA13DRAFT_1788657 [Coprinellus micaceus]